MTNKSIKRPFAIYIILLALISFAVYFFISSFLLHRDYAEQSDDLHISGYVVTFIFFVTAISLYFNKGWSRTLIYLLSLFYVAWWPFVSFFVVREMMKNDVSMLELSMFLIPGFLLLIACIGSCFVVTKYFNKLSKAA